MILPDANLLLYAYHTGAPQHEAAKSWLERALNGQAPVAFCWPTLLAFLRIGTHRRVFAAPLSAAEAAAIVASWLECPVATVVAPTERHWKILTDLLETGQATGPLVTDAHLAALALEHGATLHTNDRDFARFPGLRVEYPLLDNP